MKGEGGIIWLLCRNVIDKRVLAEDNINLLNQKDLQLSGKLLLLKVYTDNQTISNIKKGIFNTVTRYCFEKVAIYNYLCEIPNTLYVDSKIEIFDHFLSIG